MAARLFYPTSRAESESAWCCGRWPRCRRTQLAHVAGYQLSHGGQPIGRLYTGVWCAPWRQATAVLYLKRRAGAARWPAVRRLAIELARLWDEMGIQAWEGKNK